jgi:hypothetical protein
MRLKPVCRFDINPDCVAKLGIMLADKDRKKREKAYNDKTRQIKQRYESLADCAEKLSVACNFYIRERDYDKPCISCYQPIRKVWKNYHAGHFIPYGSKYKYSPIRFDERNIMGQCAGCNTYRNGRQADYEQGLIERYGKSHVDEVKELKRKCDSGEIAPLMKDEMKAMTKDFNRRARELKRSREARQ